LSKFKEGDKVRYIKKYRDDSFKWVTYWDEKAGLELGKIYVVKSAPYNFSIVLEGDEQGMHFHAEFFELAEGVTEYNGRCAIPSR
jgi:hypothetical protein